MSNDMDLKFGADTAGVGAGARQVVDYLDTIAGKSKEIQDVFEDVRNALVAVFAVDKIQEFISHVIDLGNDAQRTATQLGMTAREIAFANEMADRAGTSHDEMRRAYVRLISSMKAAKDESSEQAAAFKALGIPLSEVKEGMKDLDGFLLKVGSRFANFADGPNKTAIATTLFSKAGADLIPVLNEMGTAAEDYRKSMAEIDTVMTSSMIAGIQETRKGIAGLNSQFENAAVVIFSYFKPAIDELVIQVAELVKGFNDSASKGGTMSVMLNQMAGVINLVVGALAMLIAGFKTLWTIATTIVSDITIRLTTMATNIKDALSGDWGKIADNNAQMNAALAQNNHDAVNDITGAWKKYYDEIMAMERKKNAAQGNLSGSNDKPGAAKPDAPDLTKYDKGSAEKEIQALMAKYDTMQQLAQENYQEVMRIEELKLAALKRFYGQDSKEYQNELRKKIQLEQRHVRESVKVWTDAFKQIGASFKQSIKGLIDGTMTWRDAFRTVMQGVLSMFMDAIEKMIMKWIEKEMIETAASTTGSAQRAAAATAADTATGTSLFATIIKKIISFAQETFAGVFAFLSGIMGPAAAGPAAASSAAVMATTAAVGSFAVGSWDIPEDQLAMVHAGEMIVPKNFADQARQGGLFGGGDGGGEMNVNIRALDARSVARLLRSNSSALADAVKLAKRNLKGKR